MRRVVWVTALLAAAGVASGGAAGPTLQAVHPNPVADGDAGEFVVLSVPPGTDLGEYALADDETRVGLPNATTGGRVTVSTDPNATRELLDREVYPLSDRLRLANDGDWLRLVHEGTVVDTLRYRNAPEGELRVAQRGWRPLGATDRPVVRAGPGQVTAFALPDAPEVPVNHLRAAEERILLAGYTLSSRRVADALVAAHGRNVSVRVLVDADPVGGMTRRQANILDRLHRAGLEVRAIGGVRARYAFHHAKYAVVDDRALVTTENWKPAGVGGRSSRGWGVVTGQSRIVRGLVETFRADAAWRDARPWRSVRPDGEFANATAADGRYPSRFDPARVRVEGTRLLVAPDNAEGNLRGLLARANESIAVEQVSIGDRNHPFVRATLAAARRGVRVRILLSGAWYAREDNERLVSWLNERADSEGLPLEARIADPRGRFEKIHAKAILVDGERVALGSLNWNNHSLRENREVVLVLEGEAVGGYYRRVFAADWHASGRTVPVGVAAAVALAAAAVLLRARSVRFEP